MSKIRLYHTGYSQIPEPDVHHGRKNADFGQGFYLTKNREFACRWATERKGVDSFLNEYELELEGLSVRRFNRDESWFDYIYGNRAFRPDPYPDDVILGPIANDTIYDTFGILTSGMIPRDKALQLFLVGPEYEQIVIKTEKAVRQLTWLGAQKLDPEELKSFRQILVSEEKEYQAAFARRMEEL